MLQIKLKSSLRENSYLVDSLEFISLLRHEETYYRSGNTLQKVTGNAYKICKIILCPILATLVKKIIHKYVKILNITQNT